MKTLAHLTDAVLRRKLIDVVARDRATTAELLAHIAEFDARKLYVPEGYSSMHAYCVGELHLSEDAAYKRIRTARAARRFPSLLEAVEDGRIHLAAACLLSPHLTPENVDGLTEAATHRRKSEVEELIARSFPGSDGAPPVFASIRPVARPASAEDHDFLPFLGGAELQATDELAPGPVELDVENRKAGDLAPAPIGPDREHPKANEVDCQLAPGPVAAVRAAVSLLPERYLVQVTIEKSTHEKLRRIQGLLSHTVPSGDIAQVLDHIFDVALESLEKRKIGADPSRPPRPRAPRSAQSRTRTRYIPAPIRRAVWERDRGQCTFVSKTGHRCGERRFLEFDHVEPVARGGTATVNGLRLRCRAHNQYEAERVFGVGFMSRKRENARLAAAERATMKAVADERAARAAAREQATDVLAGLRSLGCRADEARRAAQLTETLQGASLEERMRVALGFISRRFTHQGSDPRPKQGERRIDLGCGGGS